MRKPLAAAATLLTIMLAAIPHARAHLAVSCPRIVSHRTNMLERPENTVAGIQSVPATGADGIEMDVQWSSTSFPVLMHDADVSRTTNGTGTPASLGLGQLRALSAADYIPWRTDPAYGGFNADGAARTPVPYGYEFMSATSSAGLDAVLDIHATPTQLGMQKLRIYVADYFGWASRTILMGPASWVTSMHGWEPSLRYAVIEYPPAGRIYTAGYLASVGASVYVIPWDRVTAAEVAYYHEAGIQVYAWTSDQPAYDIAANWTTLGAAGIDGLITNQPAAARGALCPGVAK